MSGAVPRTVSFDSFRGNPIQIPSRVLKVLQIENDSFGPIAAAHIQRLCESKVRT
jgi:hypothetical protein